MTRAIMKNLDLVILPRRPGPLAGAWRVPVWAALAAISDWKFLADRETIPWYRRCVVASQRWATERVFERMAEELDDDIQ